jgi:NAD(P)H dehydrogenase (quinone)
MIAVTGSTGQLGGRVAARLARKGVTQRLIVRDPNRAPKLPGAEVAQIGSYGDAEGMKKALAGIETMLLIPASDRFGVVHRAALKKVTVPPYDRLQQQITAIDSAAAAGVKRIIYISAINGGRNTAFVLAGDHYHTEEHIRSLGITSIFLRIGFYTDKLPDYPAADGVIRAPAGEGRAAFVTRDDIADVAVAVLTGNGHDGLAYDITGPESLSMADVADRLSAATGRKITYESQSPQEARTLRNTSRMDRFEAERKALTGSGLSDFEVEVFVTHFAQIASSKTAKVSDTVPILTGHPAQSFAEFLQKYPESYQRLLKPGERERQGF